MSNLTISLLVLVATFSGYLIGELISRFLPENHLSGKSIEIIEITRALIIGLATLTLGLLISSGKSSHDSEIDHIRLQASKTIALARILDEYGSDADNVKEVVKDSLKKQIYRDEVLMNNRNTIPDILKGTGINSLRPSISSLKPKNDEQKFLKSSALNVANEIEDYRWQTLEGFYRGIQAPLYIILGLWLFIIFITIGLVAPFNGTVLISTET